MVKKCFLVLLLLSSTAVFTSFKPSIKQQILKTVVIDAGHGLMPGGGRNGAQGTYSYEDDICLAVAKKLVAQIKKEFPDINVIETRPTANIVALKERANIANRNRGDLFISIHVNAMPPIQHRDLVGYTTEVYYTGKKKKKKHTRKVARYHYYTTPNTTAKGTQTYIWGSQKAEDKEIAVRENAPMLAEEDYKEKYGPLDVNSPEFFAFSLVKTQQFGKRSAMLSHLVEEQFTKVGRVSGGAKQRQVGIWVLQATAMPSILVETGFITNPQEETYLNSDDGQQEIANSITAALHNYVYWLEKKQTPAASSTSQSPAQPVEQVALKYLEAIENHEKGKLTK